MPDSPLIESLDRPPVADMPDADMPDADIPDARPANSGESRRGGRLGMLAILDQCLYSGTNFLTTIVIGRLAGASELGAYTLAFSITVLLISLQRSLLVAPYVVIRGDLSPDQQNDLRTAIAWWAGLLAVVASLVILVAGISIENMTVMALGICIGAAMVRDFVRRIAFSDYRFTRVIIVDGSVAVLQLGGLFAIHQWAPMGYPLNAPVALLWCGFAWGVVGLPGMFLSRHEFGSTSPRLKENLKLVWPTGRWIGLTQVISTMQAYAMPWVLAVFHSIELAGVYAACWTMVQVVSPAIEGVCNLLEPALASASNQSDRVAFNRVMTRVTLLFAILMAILIVGAIVLGDRLLGIAYGDEFASYQTILILLTVAAAIGNTSIPANKALIQRGWALANAGVAAGSLLISVVTACVCLRWIGPEGAAVGLVAGCMFGFIVRWTLLAMVSRVDTFEPGVAT